MEKEGKSMKLGLGKIRDVLKTGSGADMQQEKKEHAKGRSKAGKEETRITENEENKPETNEGNLMEALRIKQHLPDSRFTPYNIRQNLLYCIKIRNFPCIF